VGGDGGDGFEAERGDGSAVEGVGFLACGEAAELGGVRVGCVRGSGREEVVGSEPVVVGKL